jgi:hypothetical protein
MKFNLSRKIDQDKSKDYLNECIEKKIFVEIKDITSGSNEQNRYFHLLCGIFGLNYGETIEYVKQQIVKRVICPDIFKKEIVSLKNGDIIIEYSSWSEINKKDRSLVIERFRNSASKDYEIYLPSANEDEFLKFAEIEIEKNKKWL